MLTDATVVLREFREEDLPVLKSLRNDLDTQSALLSQPRPNSTARAREWIHSASSLPDGVFFVIEHDANCVGFIQLQSINTLHGTAELGIAICQTSRGKKLAFRAIELIEKYGHKVFKLRKLVLKVLSTNKRAISVYQHAGYRPVGTHEKHVWVSGKYEDVTLMEHLFGDVT